MSRGAAFGSMTFRFGTRSMACFSPAFLAQPPWQFVVKYSFCSDFLLNYTDMQNICQSIR